MLSQQLLERVPEEMEIKDTKNKQTTKKNKLKSNRAIAAAAAVKTAAAEKSSLLGKSRNQNNKKQTDSETVREMKEQMAILIEMSSRIMQQTAATGETVNEVATGVHDGLVMNEKTQAMVGDGAEANKDSFSKQRQKLDELNKYMKNIPSQFGCSGSSASGLLRCVFSLLMFVIKSIEGLFKLYLFVFSQLQHVYTNALSLLPLGRWMISSLNLIMMLFHGYLVVLILSAIGICIGKPDLCIFMIRLATKLFIKTITFIMRSFPTDIIKDLKMTGDVVRTEFLDSELGPSLIHVQGIYTETMELMKTTVTNMQSIKSNLSGIGEMAAYTTTTINDVGILAKTTTVGLTTTATVAADDFMRGAWGALSYAHDSVGVAFFDAVMMGGYVRTHVNTKTNTKKKVGGGKKIRLKISRIKTNNSRRVIKKYNIYKKIQIIGEKKYYDDIIDLVGSFRVAKNSIKPAKKDVDIFVSSHVKLAEVFLNFTSNFSYMSLDVVEALSENKKLTNKKH